MAGATEPPQRLSPRRHARGLTVVLLNAFDFCPPPFAGSYLFAHHTGQAFAPKLYGKAYSGTKGSARKAPGGLLEPLRRGMDHLLFAPLVAAVVAHQPRLVIATHHLPLLTLGRARRTPTTAHPLLNAPLFGVVTDYDAHGVWAERGIEGFAVGSRRAADDLIRGGIPEARIYQTGIPTKRAFAAVGALPDARKGGKIHALFTSGGVGVGPLAAVLATLQETDPISAVLVTGSDAAKQRHLSEQIKRRNLGAVVTAIGYENAMARRMEESDIIIGKAGGLTVSEALVAGRPLLLMGSIPGNESANESYAVEGGAALTATAASSLSRRIVGASSLLPPRRAPSEPLPRPARFSTTPSRTSHAGIDKRSDPRKPAPPWKKRLRKNHAPSFSRLPSPYSPWAAELPTAHIAIFGRSQPGMQSPQMRSFPSM